MSLRPELIAESLPFLMAYMVQLLEPGMRPLASNTLKAMLEDGVSVTGRPRDIAVDLALHFYKQFAFIIAMLLSTVSAIILTVIGPKPIFAVLGTVILIVAILLWVLRWQTLGAGNDLNVRVKHEMEMRWASGITTTVLLLLTLYVRSSTAAVDRPAPASALAPTPAPIIKTVPSEPPSPTPR
jgi:hypothetical protein